MTPAAFVRRLRGLEDYPLRSYELETLRLIRAQGLRWRSTDSLCQAYRTWSTSCYCAGWMSPSPNHVARFIEWATPKPL